MEFIIREDDHIKGQRKVVRKYNIKGGDKIIVIPEWIIRIIKEGDINKLRKIARDSKQFNK